MGQLHLRFEVADGAQAAHDGRSRRCARQKSTVRPSNAVDLDRARAAAPAVRERPSRMTAIRVVDGEQRLLARVGQDADDEPLEDGARRGR